MLGVHDMDRATGDELTRAWGLVRQSAGLAPAELAARIAEDAHVPVADLGAADHRASILLPESVAYRRTLLPLSCTEREITVATANPLSQESRRAVAEVTGRTTSFAVAPPSEITAAIVKVYGPHVADPEADAEAEVPPAAPEGPHILVVDDEAGQRALLRSILEEAGFRVDLAQDGPTAVKMLEGDPTYDLVTLDYWMDRMNGLRVLQHIRAHPGASNMPVIMVTGSGDRQIEMSLFEAGADDYVAKPIDGPLFALRIRAVLRRRQIP